jgi:hypothetical protein
MFSESDDSAEEELDSEEASDDEEDDIKLEVDRNGGFPSRVSPKISGGLTQAVSVGVSPTWETVKN